LTETDTIWLLDLPGTYMAEDQESAEKEKEKIQKYEEVNILCLNKIKIFSLAAYSGAQ